MQGVVDGIVVVDTRVNDLGVFGMSRSSMSG